MFQLICVMGLIASLGGQMMDSVDAEFREAILGVLPEDYSMVDTDFLLEEASVIAESIYSPHAPLLVQEAMRLLEAMPRTYDGLMQGMSLRDSMSLEASYLVSFLETQGAGSLDGMLYVLRFWDPVAAVSFSKTLFLGRLLPPSVLGGRTTAEKVVADRYLLVRNDPRNPIIAVQSLEDVFIMELSLQESGCYLPLSIFWYE